MKFRRLTKWVSILAVFALVLAACAGEDGEADETTTTAASGGEETTTTAGGEETTTTAASGEARQGGEITVIQVQAPVGFDPSQFATGNHPYMHNLYDTLIAMVPSSGPDPIPQLATSWEMSEDATQLTMQLVENAVFHDGSPLTSEDVAFTLEHIQDPEKGANLESRLGAIVASFETPDDYTVVFNFSRPSPGVFDLLADFFILNEAQIDTIETQPAGSGPYMLEEVVPGDSYTLVRFEDYWDEGLPYIDSIQFRVIADREAQASALLAGDADFIYQMDSVTALRVEDEEGFVLERAAAGAVTPYVLMNASREPFDDPLVRQAIAHAVDRETIINIAFPEGTAIPATEAGCQPFPPESFWYTEGFVLDVCEFNLDRARELLAEAGYPDGFSTSVNVSGNYGPPSTPDMAQLLQQNLAEIGVDMEINVLEGADARERLLASDFDMVIHEYSASNADPSFNHPSRSAGGVPDNAFGQVGPDNAPEFSAASVECSSIADRDQRKEACRLMSELMGESGHIVHLGFAYALFGMNENLEGFTVDTASHPHFKYWWVGE